MTGSGQRGRSLADFPLWEEARRLHGHLVYALSRESGIKVGVLNNQGNFVIGGSSIRLCQGNNRSSLNITKLEVLKALVREDGYGDGTSHGATWDHLLQSLQEMRDRQPIAAIEAGIGHLLNIVAEGSVRHGGCWDVLHEQLIWLRDRPSWLPLRLDGMIDLVLVQAELNYRAAVTRHTDLTIPERSWEQPRWLESWLDRYFDELLEEERAAAA